MGFFNFFNKKSRVLVEISNPLPSVQYFELSIYANKFGQRNIVYNATGKGTEWEDYTEVCIDGFDTGAMINLHSEWHHVISNRLSEYDCKTIAYETIRKFNEAMQLKTDVEVYFKVRYN